MDFQKCSISNQKIEMFQVKKKDIDSSEEKDKSFLGKKRLLNVKSLPKISPEKSNQQNLEQIQNKNIIRISLENDDSNCNISNDNEDKNKKITIIENIKNDNNNNLAHKNISYSVGRSSRYINKKNFFDKNCYICNKKRKNCITFNNEADFIKYILALVNIRKSKEDVNTEEMKYLDKNENEIKKFSDENKKYFKENNILHQYYCIQCLIHSISSDNFINMIKKSLDNKNNINEENENSEDNKNKNDINEKIITYHNFDTNFINNKCQIINNYNNNYNDNINNIIGCNNSMYQNIKINSPINNLSININMEDTKNPLKIINLDLMRMNNNLYSMDNMVTNLQKISKNVITSNDFISQNFLIQQISRNFKKLFEFNMSISEDIDKYLTYLESITLGVGVNDILSVYRLMNEIEKLKILNKMNYDQLIYTLNYYVNIPCIN